MHVLEVLAVITMAGGIMGFAIGMANDYIPTRFRIFVASFKGQIVHKSDVNLHIKSGRDREKVTIEHAPDVTCFLCDVAGQYNSTFTYKKRKWHQTTCVNGKNRAHVGLSKKIRQQRIDQENKGTIKMY